MKTFNKPKIWYRLKLLFKFDAELKPKPQDKVIIRTSFRKQIKKNSTWIPLSTICWNIYRRSSFISHNLYDYIIDNIFIEFFFSERIMISVFLLWDSETFRKVSLIMFSKHICIVRFCPTFIFYSFFPWPTSLSLTTHNNPRWGCHNFTGFWQ